MKQDNLEKAMTLMAEALKQYEEGKFDLAEHSREQANRFFDSVKEELSTEDGIEKAMYGECRNFGIIYNVIEENADKMYATKDGRKKLGKVLSAIKNNEILLHEFKVYDSFTNPKDVENAEQYVNEAINVINRYGSQKLMTENSKLVKLVKRLGFNENVDIDDDTMDLYEAVEYTLLHTPSIGNLKEYSNVKSILKENVERNNTVSAKANDMDEIHDNAVSELTEKYSKEMNEDEIRLIEDIAKSPKKAERRFNEIKSGLLEQLQTKIKESEQHDKEGWEQIYETVDKKQFNLEKTLSDISEMISLSETIE